MVLMENRNTGTGFNGPIFVVGLSRSGTTLLRNLLNGHSRVNMPSTESHFIPMLVEQYGKKPDLKGPENIRKLVRDIDRTTFVSRIRRTHAGFDAEKYLQTTDFSSWPGILEPLFRMMAAEPGRQDTIWGDKTPGYLVHVPLLKELFPESRFIHIVRDVRDRVLSVSHMWGKSRIRAAAQWAEQIECSLPYRERYRGDYLEVRYEDLLDDPDRELARVCSFLDISYEPDMKQLTSPSERFGDARGRLEITRGNTRKYMTRMSRRLMRKVEEPAWHMMKIHGYEPLEAKSYRPVSRFRLAVYVFFDRLAHVRFNIRHLGLCTGLKRAFQVYREDRVQPGRFLGEK